MVKDGNMDEHTIDHFGLRRAFHKQIALVVEHFEPGLFNIVGKLDIAADTDIFLIVSALGVLLQRRGDQNTHLIFQILDVHLVHGGKRIIGGHFNAAGPFA